MAIQIFDGVRDGEIVSRDATPAEEAAIIAAIRATQPEELGSRLSVQTRSGNE